MKVSEKKSMLEDFRANVLKAGIHLNVAFSLLNVGLISYSLFEESINLSLIRFGIFCKFLSDFWIYLGGKSFSQRIGKIRKNLEKKEMLKIQCSFKIRICGYK